MLAKRKYRVPNRLESVRDPSVQARTACQEYRAPRIRSNRTGREMIWWSDPVKTTGCPPIQHPSPRPAQRYGRGAVDEYSGRTRPLSLWPPRAVPVVAHGQPGPCTERLTSAGAPIKSNLRNIPDARHYQVDATLDFGLAHIGSGRMILAPPRGGPDSRRLPSSDVRFRSDRIDSHETIQTDLDVGWAAIRQGHPTSDLDLAPPSANRGADRSICRTVIAQSDIRSNICKIAPSD